MDEEKKITLYSYSKVWRVEKKIYAFGNIILPCPIGIYDLLYFIIFAFIMTIFGNLIPIITEVPIIIRLVIVPYFAGRFVQKKKLDGKNPIKYFFGYIKYVFVDKGTYIERFNKKNDKTEKEVKINWVCSKGR